MSDTMTRKDDTSCAYTYTVRRGDSFYLIARRLGVPLRDLMNANPDIHPARLMVGDELCIPSCADHEAQEPANPEQPSTPETPDDNQNAGDQTGGENSGNNNDTNNGENGGNNNDANNGDSNTNNGETQPPADTQPDAPEITTCPENRRAVVQEGQTVADIQLAYDRSFHTLEAANPTLDLDDLQAGQTVCVPPVNLPCALPASVVLGENETLESLSMRFNLPVATLLRANPCLAPDDFTQGVTVKLPQ